jgi:hypothetical protein
MQLMPTLRFLSALVVLGTASALAAVAIPATVEDLARSSDAVVRGHIVKVSAQWSGDGRRISTSAEVETTSIWRGNTPRRLTVVVPGGVVGNIGQRVDGSPRFSEREDVVLFLAKSGDAFLVRGLGQGKFSIVNGQAEPHLAGFAFVEKRALTSGERISEPMGVDELERRVRAVR